MLRRWANGGNNPVGGGEDEEKLRTEKTWRESVIWYLGRALEAAGEVQRGMMERRLEREVERSRSVLYMSRGAGAGLGVGAGAGGGKKDFVDELGGKNSASNGFTTSKSPISPTTQNWNTTIHTSTSSPPDTDPTIESTLTPSQLQLFARENQAMLKQYEDTLDQVRFVLSLPFPSLPAYTHTTNTYPEPQNHPS